MGIIAIKIIDLGKSINPNKRAKKESEIKEPKDDAFTILTKSDKLVYLHSLYKPKNK